MTILHIDSSITGENSASRAITGAIVERIRSADPGARVIYRDLVANPIPHLTLDAFAANQDVDEFLGVDTIVIGAPMYNFTLPTQLKAWIDRIAIAGKTFRYTADGPEGLAGGRRVIIALARGGVYSQGSPAAAFEHLESYLRSVFNFVGIEPEFLVAEGLNLSPEQRETAIREAQGEGLRLAA